MTCQTTLSERWRTVCLPRSQHGTERRSAGLNSDPRAFGHVDPALLCSDTLASFHEEAELSWTGVVAAFY